MLPDREEQRTGNRRYIASSNTFRIFPAARNTKNDPQKASLDRIDNGNIKC